MRYFDVNLMGAYRALKESSKTPWWTFSGPAIVALITAWGFYVVIRGDAENAELVLAPQKGDLYYVQKENKQFTLYKVDEAVSDSVRMLVSDYEAEKRYDVRHIKEMGDAAYSDDTVTVRNKDIKRMFDEGTIVNVERK